MDVGDWVPISSQLTHMVYRAVFELLSWLQKRFRPSARLTVRPGFVEWQKWFCHESMLLLLQDSLYSHVMKSLASFSTVLLLILILTYHGLQAQVSQFNERIIPKLRRKKNREKKNFIERNFP